MNRNVNSKFSKAPLDIDIQRSRFHRPSSHKTTMNASYLYPIYVDEVLPGDTFDMTMATLARMSTPVFPVMDDCYLDTFFFFVPNRLVWDHWKQLMGENNLSAWTSDIEYNVPQISPASWSGWTEGAVGDHFGLPTNSGRHAVSALPFRAYRLIWNEWFRDQNLQDPLLVNTGDTETDNTYDQLLKVCKLHDYFTSALPAPQKAPDVLIPINVNNTDLPVYAHGTNNIFDAKFGKKNTQSLRFSIYSDRNVRPAAGNVIKLGFAELDDNEYMNNGCLTIDSNVPDYSANSQQFLYPANLFASVDGYQLGTVNQLRTAFQIQKLYERDARSGTRYVESLKAHFGVTAADQSLQRPQYLGGERIAININQVVQTSSTDETSPQGNTAAFSKTVSKKHLFNNSFTEHGMIIGLACIRTVHTYQQGINRFWSKKTRLDFYTPELANIGEQPIYNKELYYNNIEPDVEDPANNEVFGYQEAWADYRYKPSIVTGSFKHNSTQGSLDAWTYADYFAERPYLSAEFVEETDANIDRTLAVSSDIADQFLLDMYFDLNVDRPMPVYSVPGLADHH